MSNSTKRCKYCIKVNKADDILMCTKYNSYCYLEEPDLKVCIEMYGSDKNDPDYNIITKDKTTSSSSKQEVYKIYDEDYDEDNI